MLTVEAIEQYGFKECKKLPHDNYDRCWALMIHDKYGKKFQVVIKFWNFSKYSRHDRVVEDSFSADCQFDMRGPKTFNVDIHAKDMTPQEIVNWFDNMFQKMECTYYERYNDD
jgi:hypothetical protein